MQRELLDYKYSLEFEDDKVYITQLGSDPLSCMVTDSDFIGTKEECIKKINSHNSKKICGAFRTPHVD